MSIAVGDRVSVLATAFPDRWSKDAQAAMVGLTGEVVETIASLKSDLWRGPCALVRFDNPPRQWAENSEHATVAQFWFSFGELAVQPSRTAPLAENESHADCAEINHRLTQGE